MGAAQVVAQSADDGDTTTASAAELSDGELVAAHLDGNGQAFEALYERYHPRLLAFCHYRTKTQQNAEDVAHDVIVRALTYLEGFDRDRPMWPWLKQIATNALADHYKSSSREVDRPDEDLDGADPEANEHTVWLAERDALLQAMDSLSPRDRSVLKLKYGNDWDSEELQDLLNVERSALYKILQRARNRLHSAYEELADSKLGILLPGMAWRQVRLVFSRLRARFNDFGGTTLATPVASFEVLVHVAAVVAIGVGLVGLAPDGSSRPKGLDGELTVQPDEYSEWKAGQFLSDGVESYNPRLSSSPGSLDPNQRPAAPDVSRRTAQTVEVSSGDEALVTVSVSHSAEKERSEEARTLNARLESQLGGGDGPWVEAGPEIYCTGSQVNEALCGTYDQVDESVPPTGTVNDDQGPDSASRARLTSDSR